MRATVINNKTGEVILEKVSKKEYQEWLLKSPGVYPAGEILSDDEEEIKIYMDNLKD
jgi:hypothetical protein